MSEEKKLPWRCPDHPQAQIKKSWDRTFFVYGDGYPRGSGLDSNFKYECSECGRELAATFEESSDFEESKGDK